MAGQTKAQVDGSGNMSSARQEVFACSKRGRGFTLIELVIALTIVGILASIAIPSYIAYVQRANRAQAKQFMSDLANREEQYFLDQRNYTAIVGTGGLSTTPPSETNGYYTFGISVAPANDCLGVSLPALGYTIAATAIGAQAKDGDLCLDSLNQKTPAAKWNK